MGTLFVVPTPIGNLEDITLRALAVLRAVPVVFAEDTRHTRVLLQHYGISTHIRSYHQHNKRVAIAPVLEALESGDAALVSDAGMPSISDPGFELIQAVVASPATLEVLPGPSAVVAAVVSAALPAPGFLFLGFLPRSSSQRRRRLESVASLPFSLVFYEAPHRVRAALKDMLVSLGDRQMAAVREMSKLHGETLRGTISELVLAYDENPPRGEFTLVVSGAPNVEIDRSLEALDQLRARVNDGQDARTSIQEVAERCGTTRNETYRLWLRATNEKA